MARTNEQKDSFVKKFLLPALGFTTGAVAMALVAPKVFGKKAEKHVHEKLSSNPELANLIKKHKHALAFIEDVPDNLEGDALVQHISKHFEDKAHAIGKLATIASLEATRPSGFIGTIKSLFKKESPMSPQHLQEAAELYDKVHRAITAIPTIAESGMPIHSSKDWIKALEGTDIDKDVLEAFKKDKRLHRALDFLLSHNAVKDFLNARHIDESYLSSVLPEERESLVKLNAHLNALTAAKLGKILPVYKDVFANPRALANTFRVYLGTLDLGNLDTRSVAKQIIDTHMNKYASEFDPEVVAEKLIEKIVEEINE